MTRLELAKIIEHDGAEMKRIENAFTYLVNTATETPEGELLRILEQMRAEYMAYADMIMSAYAELLGIE